MIIPEGITIIKKFEGLRTHAYKCPAGVWTIGYGTTRDWDKNYIEPDRIVSRSEAELLLERDVQKFELGVRNLVRSPTNPAQLAALVSFTYNLGLRSLEISQLLMHHNKEQYNRAADKFLDWVYARVNGKKIALDGLKRRREAERELYISNLE